MATSRPSDNNRLHFPLLQAVLADPEGCYRLKPKDVDALGVEISLAYKRCSEPESRVSLAERQINELLLGCIGTIDFKLEQRSSTSPEIGALLVLYRRTILTPPNLKALFQMANPNIRTGKVRCHAIWHLSVLRKVGSVWGIRLEDGTSFAMEMITAMATTLAPTSPSHGQTCDCYSVAWGALSEALGICSDPVEDVVSLLDTFDWPGILKREDAPVLRSPDKVSFCDLVLFVCLRRWPLCLLQKDPNSDVAKKQLQVLGRCDAVFRRCLRSVTAGSVWSDVKPAGNSSRLDDLGPVINFLYSWINCLVAIPDDNELDALMRRARNEIMVTLSTSLIDDAQALAINPENTMYRLNVTNSFLATTDHDQWQALKHETDQARRERFRNNCQLIGGRSNETEKSLSKKIKKLCRKSLKETSHLTEGEMCANCFMLEAKLKSKLNKCSRCRQIKYCSRECQREHWKKSHKKQCRPTKSSSS